MTSALNKCNNVHFEVFHLVLFCTFSSDVHTEDNAIKTMTFFTIRCMFILLQGSLYLFHCFCLVTHVIHNCVYCGVVK